MHVSTQTELPPRWHATIWPEEWDPENDHYPDPKLQKVGRVLLPERFTMTIHWPELNDGNSDHGGALVIAFEVIDDELQVRDLWGYKMDVAEWISFFVQEFPPEKWKQFAKEETVRLLAIEEVPDEVGRSTAAPALKRGDLRQAERPNEGKQEGRKRHRITTRHLEEVAKIYVNASSRGKPPTMAVADHFSVAHSTAAKWVGRARKAGLLAASPRRQGEGDYAKVTGHD